MSAGTVAEQLLGAGGGDLGAELDFVNGVYTVNGQTVLIADLIDHPERVTPGSGLEIKASTQQSGGSAEVVYILDSSPFFDLMQRLDWTVLLEVQTANSTGAGGGFREFYITMVGGDYEGATNDQLTLYDAGGSATMFEEETGSATTRLVFSDWGQDTFPGSTLTRIAYTRALQRFHIAQDGENPPTGPSAPDQIDDTTVMSPPPQFDQIVLADSWSGAPANGYIRSIIVYVPRKPASALSDLTFPGSA